jgi:hypothetical protein
VVVASSLKYVSVKYQPMPYRACFWALVVVFSVAVTLACTSPPIADGDEVALSGDIRLVERSAALGLPKFDGDAETFMDDVVAARDPLIDLARSYGGALTVEDFDLDGRLDIFIGRVGAEDLLFKQRVDGTFVQENDFSTDVYSTSGSVAADFDGDGRADLFVSGHQPGDDRILFQNDQGLFDRRILLPTGEAGVAGVDEWSSGGTAADLDLDGDLDLIVNRWRRNALPRGHGSHVFLNDGSGNFTSGLDDSSQDAIARTAAFTSSVADLNDDGIPDLLLTGDWSTSAAFVNTSTGNGPLAFQDVTDALGIQGIDSGMGSSLVDIDVDGDLDWYMTSIGYQPEDCADLIGCTGNKLYLRDGETFSEVATDLGVELSGWSWGAASPDLDHDGLPELLVVSGILPEEAQGLVGPSHPLFDPLSDEPPSPLRLWHRSGRNEPFVDRATGTKLENSSAGRAVVPADLDNDGDVDLLIYRAFVGVEVWMNESSVAGRLAVISPRRGVSPTESIFVTYEIGDEYRRQIVPLQGVGRFGGSGPRVSYAGIPNGATDIWFELVESGSVTDRSSVEGLFDGEYLDLELGGHTVSIHPAPAVDPASTPAERLSPGSPTVPAGELECRSVAGGPEGQSPARIWNEAALDAIRLDFPAPTVHARNLYHLSAAMWDSWAAFDPQARGVYLDFDVTTIESEELGPAARAQLQQDAVARAGYVVLRDRYARSVNAKASLARFDEVAAQLCVGDPYEADAGLGTVIGQAAAEAVLAAGRADGARELDDYRDPSYTPKNDPMVVKDPGSAPADVDRWQPLQIERARTQNGLPSVEVQAFIGSHWGRVATFSDLVLGSDGGEPWTRYDPGPPPFFSDNPEQFVDQAIDVLRYAAQLGSDDRIDISPRALGNNPLGTNDGTGHPINPSTGASYVSQYVRRADFGRVVAEFWADGPDSETPPGHWNAIANSVSDELDYRLPESTVLGSSESRLEWDLRMFLGINGALHDAGVAAWGTKAHYDYGRPISMVRFLAEREKAGSHVLGSASGVAETVTIESSSPGGRHAHLALHSGKSAVYSWSPGQGVAWVLAESWVPYQRDDFVTPAFAGYVSGHSAFSRAAAEVLAEFTGSPFFPGGLDTFTVESGDLVFDDGPSEAVQLQWATYFDAADQAGVSRLYGGIHVEADDLAGRRMGEAVGRRSVLAARNIFGSGAG